MNTSLLAIVKWIIDRHGEGILGDPARLKPVFANFVQNEPKDDRTAFGRCIEMGCYRELKKARTEAERGRIKALLALKLQNNSGLHTILCRDTLDLLDAAVFGNTAPTQWLAPQTQNAYPSTRTKSAQNIKTLNSPAWKKLITNSKNVKWIALGIGISVLIVLIFWSTGNIPKTVFSAYYAEKHDDQKEALKRITESQEQIAWQLEQLKKQIEDEHNEPKQNTSRQKSEKERLIEKLNNELLMEILTAKRHGMRDITGKIKVIVVPVNYKDNPFNLNLNNLSSTVQDGINVILRQARKYNQNHECPK